jgi:hypothetical protein
MADIPVSAKTVLIAGTVPDAGQTIASGDTITITAPAGEALDFSNLVLRLRSSAGSVTTYFNIGVSSGYSSLSQGAYRVAVPSASTVYIGGKDFESARFKTVSAQSLILTQATGASVIFVEAVKLPSGFTG